MRMLEKEDFVHDRYVDIFDGGPTMTARTDQVRSINNARTAPMVAVGEGGQPMLVAAGHLRDFRACYAQVTEEAEGVALDQAGAALLGVSPGETVCYIARV